MKTILFYFLLTILAVSCQLKQSENTEKEVSDNVSNSDTEECIADTISATAIFWIDKAETKHCKEWGFRTVKAKVLIHENGKVDLEAFVKKQSPDMEKYVRHHLAKFQVSEKMLESGYVQPGEQFVQLRCLYGKVKAKYDSAPLPTGDDFSRPFRLDVSSLGNSSSKARNCSFIRWKPEFLRLETVISHKPQWIKIPNFAFSNQEGTGLVSKDSHAGA